jgi:threonylcarbamoyladenosine tRNA methylthiotransferase MtaB
LKELDKCGDIPRFRLSSVEPNLMSDDIIRFIAGSQRFMPHFHMPLQSGSNVILRAMKRRYLRELYAERVEMIRKLMPHACIGADVITGFPGETDAHFNETYEFIRDLDISYLHVFTYSERDNTEAALSADVVPVETRRRRNKMLRILSSKKLAAFYASQKERTHNVLFEQENKDGFISGYSENYLRFRLPFDSGLVNRIVEVTGAGEAGADGIPATMVAEKATV